MHVLYFIDSLVLGGAEQSLVGLAPHLRERGVRLDVAYLHDRPGLQHELEVAGARSHCLAGPGGRLGWLSRSRALVRGLRPDLVHTTLFEADLAGRTAAALVHVPAVSSLVNVPYGPEHVGDPGLRTWRVRAAQVLDATTARFAVRFHAVAEFVADTMAKRLRIRRDHIDVVYRGRDENSLGRRTPERRTAARARLGLGANAELVLAVARQEHQKGLDALLAAFAEVHRQRANARLVVAGREGNQTPLLQGLVGELGIDQVVRFLGARNDVPDLLTAADVFVLPSRREGLPGALLEAMALETPAVASDLPGVREALGDVRGPLVPPADPGALTRAILLVLSDSAQASERAHQARDRFLALFTMPAAADGMVAFYERAAQSHRRTQ